MPEPKAKAHAHPSNMHAQLYGKRLVDGDVLEENDGYASSNGFWEKCPCPGLTLGPQAETLWVRPVRPPEGTVFIRPESSNPPDQWPFPDRAAPDD